MFFLQRSCEIQVMAQSGGRELIPMPKPILEGRSRPGRTGHAGARGLGGALAWPGILRKLDRLDDSFRM